MLSRCAVTVQFRRQVHLPFDNFVNEHKGIAKLLCLSVCYLFPSTLRTRANSFPFLTNGKLAPSRRGHRLSWKCSGCQCGLPFLTMARRVGSWHSHGKDQISCWNSHSQNHGNRMEPYASCHPGERSPNSTYDVASCHVYARTSQDVLLIFCGILVRTT